MIPTSTAKPLFIRTKIFGLAIGRPRCRKIYIRVEIQNTRTLCYFSHEMPNYGMGKLLYLKKDVAVILQKKNIELLYIVEIK